QAGGAGTAALPARRRPHRLDHGALSHPLSGLGQGRRARRNAERPLWLSRRLGQHPTIYPARERGASAARGRRATGRAGAELDGAVKMKLYVTYGSPYARLARIIVIEKELEDRVEIIEAKTRAPGS